MIILDFPYVKMTRGLKCPKIINIESENQNKIGENNGPKP